MKFLNCLVLLLFIQAQLLSQCQPSDYPLDTGMYDIHLCLDGNTYYPSKEKMIHKEVEYYFASLTPTTLATVLEIDFDDGQGWQNVVDGELAPHYSIVYPSSGTKMISIRYEYEIDATADDGLEEAVTVFMVEIKEQSDPYESPDIIWELETEEIFIPPTGQYPTGSPYAQAATGQGNAYIKLADGHTELTRPIIFVEGLDFGKTMLRDPNKDNKVIRYGANGWDVFETGASEVSVVAGDEELFQNVPAQFADFNMANYDVILLDFKDGADYIEKNVEVLKELLNRVNAEKMPDVTGTFHSNVIVGASMGAIISRYALAEMEKDGIPHCTGTYLSFDGPHKGANISLGLQSLIWFNHAFGEPGDEAALSQWKDINRPAARQLINQNLLGAYQLGLLDINAYEAFMTGGGFITSRNFSSHDDMSIDYNSLRTDFRIKLASLGYPQKTWNIAIANGNSDGQNIGFEDGDELLNADIWGGSIVGEMALKIKLWAINGGVYSDEDFGVSFSSDQTIFYGKRPVGTLSSPLPPVPTSYGVTAIWLTGTLPSWDNAPGSVRNDIVNSIVPILEELPSDDGQVVNNFLPNVTFIPTVSALDLNTTDLFYEVNDISPNNPNSDLTPFSRIYYPSSYEAHVKTNNGNRLWTNEQISLLSEDLSIFGVLPNSLGSTYNYGLARKIVPEITINSNGVLRVNDEGSTAYLTQAVTKSSSFSVFTTDCGEGNITINSGGSLILGSDLNDAADRKGNLHITEGNRLHLQAGGTIRLQKDSKLIIESGATLEIDEGANMNLWWGESNIHIKEGGELRINGDFNFEGSGYFQFDEGHLLSFGSNATAFRIHGEAYTNRILKLNNNARLQLSNIDLDLQNGTVECHSGSGIDMDGGTVRTSAVRFDGDDNLMLRLNAPEALNISFTRFYDAFTAISLHDFNGEAPSQGNIRQTDFYNCKQGVLVSNTNAIFISSCSFQAQNLGQSGGAAIRGENVSRIDLKYSSIYDYQTPAGFGAVELRSVGMFNLVSSTINNASTGVLAPCQSEINNTTNVSLNGSTISNCETGIHLEKGGIVEGGLDFGLVQMVCSKLINNGTGITGTDILLNIDAYIQEPEVARPNSFILGSTGHTYFDITYVDRIDTETISATGNYWDTNPLSGFFTAANYIFRKSNSYTACQVGDYGGENALLNVSGKLEEEPINCLNTPPGPGEIPNTDKELFSGDCGLMIKANNEKQLLGQQYVKAAWALKSEDHSTAIDRYSSLAKISNKRRNGAGQTCRHYIDVARVMANIQSQFATGYEDGGVEDSNLFETSELRSLKVWPNPARSVVQVYFGLERYDLFVYDVLGKEVFAGEIADGVSFDVSEWGSGIYLLKVIDSETGKQYSEKLIIN